MNSLVGSFVRFSFFCNSKDVRIAINSIIKIKRHKFRDPYTHIHTYSQYTQVLQLPSHVN